MSQIVINVKIYSGIASVEHDCIAFIETHRERERERERERVRVRSGLAE
jgi:hypothetical protein